jgi:hypothetical protein
MAVCSDRTRQNHGSLKITIDSRAPRAGFGPVRGAGKSRRCVRSRACRAAGKLHVRQCCRRGQNHEGPCKNSAAHRLAAARTDLYGASNFTRRFGMPVTENQEPDLYNDLLEKNLSRQDDLLRNFTEIGLRQGPAAINKHMLWLLNHVAGAGIFWFGGRFNTLLKKSPTTAWAGTSSPSPEKTDAHPGRLGNAPRFPARCETAVPPSRSAKRNEGWHPPGAGRGLWQAAGKTHFGTPPPLLMTSSGVLGFCCADRTTRQDAVQLC